MACRTIPLHIACKKVSSPALSSSAGTVRHSWFKTNSDSIWVRGQGLNKAESATHCGHAEGMPGEIRCWMFLIEIEWNPSEIHTLARLSLQIANTEILTPQNYHACSKSTSTTWLAKGTGLASQNGWVAAQSSLVPCLRSPRHSTHAAVAAIAAEASITALTTWKVNKSEETACFAGEAMMSSYTCKQCIETIMTCIRTLIYTYIYNNHLTCICQLMRYIHVILQLQFVFWFFWCWLQPCITHKML